MTSLRAYISSTSRMLASLAACLALALGSSGCSSPETPPNTCASSADCAAGKSCISGQCVKLELPCDGKCKDDQACVNEACVPAQNLDCSVDPARCPKAFTCSNGRCKRSCTIDQDCPEPATCNIDLFICAECALDRDCTDPTRPVCDQSQGSCVGCLTHEQCKEGGLAVGKYCDQTTLTCQPGCTSLAECPLGTKDCLGATQEVIGQCIECTVNSDCTESGKGYCDTVANKCVECLGNANCASNQCDIASHRCVECVDDSVCPPQEICNPNTFKCTPGCTGGSGDGNRCLPATPACDPNVGQFGTCVVCVANTDCPRGNVCSRSGTPACVPGCDGDARCAPTETEPTATNTICDPTKGGRGTCVQCRSDANCPTSQICDSVTGSCRCKAPGEACSSTAECGSLVPNMDGSTSISCSKPATNNPYFCMTQVKCAATGERTVPSVCTAANKGAGLPDHNPPDPTGCPSGFVTERAKDATGVYIQVCVPDQSPYTCH